MDSYHVFWLLDELKTLTQKQVISEEEANRIAAYYASVSSQAQAPSATGVQKQSFVPDNVPNKKKKPSIYQDINQRNELKTRHRPSFTVKNIPVLLSIIAAILIASGIISLIAYNWYAIPRMAKALSAFVLLLAVQAGGVLIHLDVKRFSKTRWKDGAAVLWALLFGGVVAYISQICRLPGNSSSFVLVWAISSILLTYAMQSVGVFILSLLLSAAYAVVSSTNGEGAALFYLLFAALCPFARRFRYGPHAMLILAAAMMGFVLEKSIPGLWIVCSISFAVLSLEYGLSRGFKVIVSMASAGLCVLLLVLSNNSLWLEIGWQHVRDSRSLVGMLLDSALAIGLVTVAIAWSFVPRLHKGNLHKWQLVYPCCALVVGVLFIAYACFPLQLQRSLYLAPTCMVFLLSLLFVAHSLYGRKLHSVFLLCFLCVSALTAQLNLPVFAFAAFFLLLEATGAFPTAVMRGLGFCLLLLATACLYKMPFLQYRMPRPEALPLQLVLYGLYLLGAIALFSRSKRLAKSFDIIGVAAGVILFSILGLAFPFGKNELGMGYFCIMLFACAYHVIHHERLDVDAKGRLGMLFYWLPFAALTGYFFWTALFVLQLNYPILAGSSFLLLFEAAACCRVRRNPREEQLLAGISRFLLACWMLAAFFLCKEGLAFAVYETAAVPFQIASYACILLAALVLLIYSASWKPSLDFLIALGGLVALSLAFGQRNYDSPAAFIFLFALAGLYGFVRLRKDGRRIYIPYIFLFAGASVAFLEEMTRTFFLCSPFFPLFAALSFYGKEWEARSGGGKASLAGRFGEVACIVIIYVTAFVSPRFYYLNYPSRTEFLPLLLTVLLSAGMTLHPVFLQLRGRLLDGEQKKPACNYLIALYALVIFICQIILLSGGLQAEGQGASPRATGVASALSYISFASIFLTAGFYIYQAYRDGSLAKANLCAAYAALALVIKFFSDDYGFVAKGILFIVLGLAMLALNLLLYRMDRKKKLDEEGGHDVRS